jgi:predicted NUDIX family NTP pyrophosphohydrolase
MTRRSAGLLMYRHGMRGPEVLLVHPGGPFWARKDEGVWSIPKGEYRDEEDPLEAARREFLEETGFAATGTFIALAPLKQKSGKIISAWAFEGDCDASAIRSNTFTMEWPSKSGKQAAFPEVDRAGWFGIGEAKKKLSKGQTGFVDELSRILSERSEGIL